MLPDQFQVAASVKPDGLKELLASRKDRFLKMLDFLEHEDPGLRQNLEQYLALVE